MLAIALACCSSKGGGHHSSPLDSAISCAPPARLLAVSLCAGSSPALGTLKGVSLLVSHRLEATSDSGRRPFGALDGKSGSGERVDDKQAATARRKVLPRGQEIVLRVAMASHPQHAGEASQSQRRAAHHEARGGVRVQVDDARPQSSRLVGPPAPQKRREDTQRSISLII